MKFTKTAIEGVYLVELEKREDERGYLSRTWDLRAFEEHGICLDLVEGYVSQTRNRGTIRGLHYQAGEFAEAKLVRCTRGSFFEVVADVRKDSPTFGEWLGLSLAAAENKMLYVPPLCAHGVLVLEDNTELMSFASRPYAPECERGVRYDDPFFRIEWPIPVTSVSSKDSNWEDFHDHR